MFGRVRFEVLFTRGRAGVVLFRDALFTEVLFGTFEFGKRVGF